MLPPISKPRDRSVAALPIYERAAAASNGDATAQLRLGDALYARRQDRSGDSGLPSRARAWPTGPPVIDALQPVRGSTP